MPSLQASRQQRIGRAFRTLMAFQSGTAEIKNWLVGIGAMNAAGLHFHLLDYVPCYRSEAGTGNAMGFAYWE